jgi:hypothetical protein
MMCPGEEILDGPLVPGKPEIPFHLTGNYWVDGVPEE